MCGVPERPVIAAVSPPVSQPAMTPTDARLTASPDRLREIVLFLAVGGTSAAIYVILCVFFTRLCGFRPSLAIVATLVIVIPPTYLSQRNLTFRSDRNHAGAFPRYLATQVAGNALAVVGSELIPAVIRSQPWLAFSVVAFGVGMTNYLLLKRWTFRRIR
jgi:putative flippase GtrA